MTERAPLLLAIGTALGLPLLGLVILFVIARAPDDFTGRVLVLFPDGISDTDAYGRVAASGARPIRVIGSVNGWIAEAENSGAAAALRQHFGASWVFRDIGLGRALAGCVGLTDVGAQPRRTIP